MQSQAARVLNLSTAALSRWECDKEYPSLRHHHRIIAYLGYDPFPQPVPNRPEGNEPVGVTIFSDGANQAVGQRITLRREKLRLTRRSQLALTAQPPQVESSDRPHPLLALRRCPEPIRSFSVYGSLCARCTCWKRCRQECADYFLNRCKENMVFDCLENLPCDWADPSNHSVLSVMSGEGYRLRLIAYTDPVTGNANEFLTNEVNLPPGVLVEFYLRRWEVEKVYDQIKNKLGEQKAWGASLVAKEAQALLVTITHNLLLLYEHRLETEHGVTNQAEDQRRAKRIETATQACAQGGQELSALVSHARRTRQRSVKFIRWLRQCLRDRTAEALAVVRLRALYAAL